MSAAHERPERTAASREARIVGGLVLVAAAAFLVLVGTAASQFMGVDDAFYLGIGANIFSGHGPVNAFGGFAGQHAPLWPIAITAPDVWFGIDAARWAHLLALAGGAGVILLGAWFASRAVRPAAVVAAATMLGFPFMVGLGTGLGLDLPAAALSLAYVAVGLTAVRRGSVRIGIGAGLLFAAAFLTKEIALPFAPVPLLAGLVRGVPLPGLLRSTAATLLTAVVATSWWFVIYAQVLGTVYRIGTPWWTLIPIGIVVLVAGIAGLAADRWLPSARRTSPTAQGHAWMWRLGWVGAIAWAVVLTVMFARTPTGLGTSFLAPSQVARDVAKWFPSLGTLLAIGLVGTAYEVGARLVAWRTRRRPQDPSMAFDDRAIDDLLIATICGIPLILLVISVNEGPRHYIAQLALLVAAGSAGWVRIVARALRRDRAGLIVLAVAIAAGLAIAYPTLRPLLTRRLELRLALLGAGVGVVVAVAFFTGSLRRFGTGRGLAAIALATMVAAASVVVSVVVPLHVSSIDRTRALAVSTIVAWAHKDLPAGTSIVLANGLAFELGLRLQADYRLSEIGDQAGVRVRAAAPLGVAPPDGSAVDDWVALRALAGDATLLAGYRASTIASTLRTIGPTTWIESEITGANQTSPIMAVLKNAPGVTVGARWTWPYGSGQMETIAFEIDPAKLAIPDRVVVTTQALARIVAGLEAGGAAARPAAAALLLRVQVADTDPAAPALLARLRKVAGAP